MLYAAEDLPDWADPNSPASQHVSEYYIEHSVNDTTIPNFVTAVLADYRGYDTMFETTVILVAGLAMLLLLRPFQHKPKASGFGRANVSNETDQVVQTTCRIVLPPMQIFALYVVAHGHHSPGGGFQGGVLLGASFILYAIAYDVRTALRDRLSLKLCLALACVGVLIYAGTGMLCLLLGGNFLDYHILSRVLPVNGPAARSLGVLIVEVGVACTVSAVMFFAYVALSTRGELDEGL